jgi:hypothetical protein
MKNRRLIISFVVLFGFSMLASGQARKSNPPRETAPNPAATKSNLRPEKARDPVCGIMVEKDPQLAAEYITTGFDDNGDTTTNDRPAGIKRNTGVGPRYLT